MVRRQASRVRALSKPQPEYLIEKEILSYLRIKGIFCFKVRNGATYDPKRKVYRKGTTLKGIADIFALLPDGKACWIEVKTPTGRATKDQKLFLDRINKSRGIGFIARSVDDVNKHLHQYYDFNPSGGALDD